MGPGWQRKALFIFKSNSRSDQDAYMQAIEPGQNSVLQIPSKLAVGWQI